MLTDELEAERLGISLQDYRAYKNDQERMANAAIDNLFDLHSDLDRLESIINAIRKRIGGKNVKG